MKPIAEQPAELETGSFYEKDKQSEKAKEKEGQAAFMKIRNSTAACS